MSHVVPRACLEQLGCANIIETRKIMRGAGGHRVRHYGRWWITALVGEAGLCVKMEAAAVKTVILSVAELTKERFEVEFDEHRAMAKRGCVTLLAEEQDGLYVTEMTLLKAEVCGPDEEWPTTIAPIGVDDDDDVDMTLMMRWSIWSQRSDLERCHSRFN